MASEQRLAVSIQLVPTPIRKRGSAALGVTRTWRYTFHTSKEVGFLYCVALSLLVNGDIRAEVEEILMHPAVAKALRVIPYTRR